MPLFNWIGKSWFRVLTYYPHIFCSLTASSCGNVWCSIVIQFLLWSLGLDLLCSFGESVSHLCHYLLSKFDHGIYFYICNAGMAGQSYQIEVFAFDSHVVHSLLQMHNPSSDRFILSCLVLNYWAILSFEVRICAREPITYRMRFLGTLQGKFWNHYAVYLVIFKYFDFI